MKNLEGIRAHIWTLHSTSAAGLARAAAALGDAPRGALVSTCTRIEFYGDHDPPLEGDAPPAIRLEGRAALAHLATVAAGADSLVAGETDVLAQVRAAFADTAGDLRAFGDAAVAAGREARLRVDFTPRDAGRQLDLALRQAGAAVPGTLCIAGTGAMAGHLARRARELGVRRVTVSGRHAARAASAAAAAHADAVPLGDLAVAAEGASLVLAFKGVASPPTQQAIVAAARVSALTIDLTMPPFAWPPDAQPRELIGLEALVRGMHDAPGDAALRICLRDVALRSADDCWEHRHGDGATVAAELYRRVEAIRAGEIARVTGDARADADVLDVVTKALVKRLFHTYGKALRAEDDPALIASTQRLFLAES